MPPAVAADDAAAAAREVKTKVEEVDAQLARGEVSNEEHKLLVTQIRTASQMDEEVSSWERAKGFGNLGTGLSGLAKAAGRRMTTMMAPLRTGARGRMLTEQEAARAKMREERERKQAATVCIHL